MIPHNQKIGRYHSFPVHMVESIVESGWLRSTLFGHFATAITYTNRVFNLTKEEYVLLTEEQQIYKDSLMVGNMIAGLQANNRPR